MTFQLPPHNEAWAEVHGDGPMLTVDNEGDGPVEVVFEVESPIESDPLTVEPHTATGRTLHASKKIRLTTGDEPTMVRVTATKATGLSVDAGRPKR